MLNGRCVGSKGITYLGPDLQVFETCTDIPSFVTNLLHDKYGPNFEDSK